MYFRHFIIVGIGFLCLAISSLAQNSSAFSVKDTTLANHYATNAEYFANEAKYDSANYYYKKACVIYEKLGYWDKHVHCLNKVGFSYIKKHELEEARKYLDQALRTGASRLVEKHTEIAESYHYIGLIYYFNGDYDYAIEFYNKSLSIKEAALGEIHPDLAKTYNNIGLIHSYKGDHKQALEFYYRALKIWRATHGDRHSNVTATYNNIGYIHMREGNYREALGFFNKALAIQVATLGENHPDLGWSFAHIAQIHMNKGSYNQALEFYQKALSVRLAGLGEKHPDVARSYGSIGIFYRIKGHYDQALEFFNMALAIWLETLGDNNSELAWVYNNMGIIYNKKGDYNRALEFYNKALSIQLANFGKKHPDVASAYNNIGTIHKDKGEYHYALEFYKQALAIWFSVFGQNHFEVGIAYKNIGDIYNYLKDYDRALEFNDKALSIRISTYGEKHPEVASSYVNLGDIFLEMDVYEKALDFYQKALAIGVEVFGNNHPFVANIYANLGKVYLEEKLIKNALAYFQESLIALTPSFSEQDYFKNPPFTNSLSDTHLFTALSLKAEAFQQLNKQDPTDPENIRMALSIYKLISKLINTMRSSYKSEGSKLFLGDKVADIYNKAIHTALNGRNPLNKMEHLGEQAFLFSEESKSAVLTQSLQNSHARRFSNIPDSLQEKENSLRSDLVFYETEIQKEYLKNEKQDTLKLRGFKNRFFSLNREYEKLVEQLEHNFPKYFALKYKTETASVTDVQQAIDNRTAFVEYFQSDSSIYIFTITQNNFDVKTVKKDSAFDYSLNALARSFKSVSGKMSYLKNASLLYQILISPIDSLIKDKRKWIIIPDSELYKVPFEALLSHPVPTPQDAHYTDLDYLVKEHQVSYHYSATLYLKSLREPKLYDYDFAGFAPVFSKGNSFPHFNANSFFSLPSLKALWDKIKRDGMNLDVLKYSEKEVKQICDMFSSDKSRVFAFQDATEENFKTYLHNTKYIHVATHGIIHTENPKLSNLVFFQPRDTSETRREDGILYSRETYNLDLDADLLVLSACQTGTGQLTPGEGLMALTRGFLYSGANNIIASLWRVLDEHTSLMMVELYKQILAGKSYSAALQGAKLFMINNKTTAMPQSWASFVLIGS